ncbi:hypothetical protein SEUCBS139899_005368 [Sporothrix eucalyptigena]
MSPSTLYDRVIAAYDLEDDEPDSTSDGPVCSPVGSPAGSLIDAKTADTSGGVVSPSSQPTQYTPDTNVNSILVPFDPDDQSDDEVVIASAYKREMLAAQKNKGSSGPSPPSKPLSATASPFKPNAAGHSVTAKPLVEISSPKAMGNPDAEYGKVYPGRRIAFCPWRIVENYHTWFVGKQNTVRVEPYFEKNKLLKCQPWDFCYVWHPTESKKSTFVLVVPTNQFQHLLDRLNETLKIQLVIPPGTFGEKFSVIFGQQKTPVPRFLGRAGGTVAFDALVKSIPPPNSADEVFNRPGMEDKAAQMYARKVDKLLYEHGKEADKKKKSEKTRAKRLLHRQASGRQIKRVQRYMGIREKDKNSFRAAVPFNIPDTSDETRAPPFPQEKDVVFVAMDIESYEFNHSAITEIGFGILDTRDLVGVPPGLNCQNWMDLIRGRHLRIREHASMVNRRHVHGSENNFNFGTSEFIPLKDILRVVKSILQPQQAFGETRKVVLVGHDIKSDISLIKNIGFHVTDDMFLDIVDTQDFYQHLRMKAHQASLKFILTDLEIEHTFLHNGGNDAVYTLQAMVRIALKKRQDSIRRHLEKLQPGYAPDPSIIEEGWNSGGEMSDGGPKKPDWDSSYAGHSGLLSSYPSALAKERELKEAKSKTQPTNSNGNSNGNGGLFASATESDDLIEL